MENGVWLRYEEIDDLINILISLKEEVNKIKKKGE